MNNQPTASPADGPRTYKQAKQTEFLQTVNGEFLQRASLLQVLERVRSHVDGVDPTELINEMAGFWLDKSGHDLNQKKSDIAQVLNLLTFLSTIRADYYCFELSTDYPKWVEMWQEGGQRRG